MGDVLYIVVPCYNEEAVLPETQKELGNKLETMITAGAVSEKSRIIFVDDGSKDRTWELIEKYHSENPRIGGVKLAHNRGHQFAVLAGLMTVKDLCDMAITMDADLQDDIDVVDKFVEKYKEGCEVVCLPDRWVSRHLHAHIRAFLPMERIRLSASMLLPDVLP